MIFIYNITKKQAESERGVDSAWFLPHNPSKVFDALTVVNATRGSCFTDDGNPNFSTGISSGPPDPSPQKESELYAETVLKSIAQPAESLAYILSLKGEVFRQLLIKHERWGSIESEASVNSHSEQGLNLRSPLARNKNA